MKNFISLVRGSSHFHHHQHHPSLVNNMFSTKSTCSARGTLSVLFQQQASSSTNSKMFHTSVFSFQQQEQVSLHSYPSSTIQEIMNSLPDPSTLNIKPRNKKTPVERHKTRQTWRDRPKITAKFLDTLPTVTFRQINIKQGPKKVNEVTEMLRGISAKEALIQLQSCEKKIAPKMYTFIRSCMLNAENVHGMNADRLLIRECIVNKQQYRKQLRYHAKGRYGVELNRRTSIVVKMVEVPEIEGEHRLGRYGWTNKTWREYEQEMLSEKTTETVDNAEIIEPEATMQEEASDNSAAESVETVEVNETPNASDKNAKQ
ncbi:hypothetical protein C9374_004704 [Naegleria lovaniensis]|uniref:Ribosomal protein L22 n=1 Tax=Naegleria lovaniensis TaxID=51637 RepID=A0AA88GRR5_NAELO|nr:uncharacterized protein C9374_004704 [Naegleria lovaniensis]KAG2383367.1 hypothetical protein C9374_004704 [Naegleria lovaniensis]